MEKTNEFNPYTVVRITICLYICCLLTMFYTTAYNKTTRSQNFLCFDSVGLSVFSLWTNAHGKNRRAKNHATTVWRATISAKRANNTNPEEKKKNEVQQKSLQLKYKSKCIDFYGLPFIQLFDLFGFSFANTHHLTPFVSVAANLSFTL